MDSKNEKELKKILARRVDPGKNGGESKDFRDSFRLAILWLPGPFLTHVLPGVTRGLVLVLEFDSLCVLSEGCYWEGIGPTKNSPALPR